MTNQRFGKAEKLKSRKEIEALFDRQGHSFGQYPMRLVWKEMEERRSDSPIQFGVSVSKRFFKKAVDRNRIKRLIREAYRLRKQPIHEALAQREQQIAFMVLFTGKKMPDFNTIDEAMKVMLKRFIKKV